ncbi:MAG: hypothetical protein KY475_01735 [Planctomycetes bacterium]|nr:hypothetical protein [Planctomycetota bacterium]
MAQGNLTKAISGVQSYDVLQPGELGAMVAALLAGGADLTPGRLGGESPLSPEWVENQLQCLQEDPPIAAGAVGEALLLYQALAAEAAAYSDASRTASRWIAGAAIEELRQSLDQPAPRRMAPAQMAELSERIAACVEATNRLSCGAGPGECCRRRRGRLFQVLQQSLAGSRAWVELAAVMKSAIRAGRPCDITRLRELLQVILTGRLSKKRRRLIEQAYDDLARLETPPPCLNKLHQSLQDLRERIESQRRDSPVVAFLKYAEEVADQAAWVHGAVAQEHWRVELDRALSLVQRHVSPMKSDAALGREAASCLKIIEAYLERPALLAQVQTCLQEVIDGPPPYFSKQEWRRRMKQLATLGRRWFEAGLRLTQKRVEMLKRCSDPADVEGPHAVLDMLEQLRQAPYRAENYAEARRIAGMIGQWQAPAPSGQMLEMLEDACREAPSSLNDAACGSDALPAEVKAAAARLTQFVHWTGNLRTFVERRMDRLDPQQQLLLEDGFRRRRFAIAPPNRRESSAFIAWLTVLPPRQREAVLEQLYLGPVRPEVLSPILTIVQAEAAVRRQPPLKPKQLAECDVAIELANPALSDLIRRDLFEPRLSADEHEEFEQHRNSLWRRYRATRSPAVRRRIEQRVRATLAGHQDASAAAPFFDLPHDSAEARDRALRCGALEFHHSLWKAEAIDDADYRAVVAQHWRSRKKRMARMDEDRRRPSLIEMLQRYVEETQKAALEAEAPTLSLTELSWACWQYLKHGDDIAARWRASVPSGLARRGRGGSPIRVEAEEAYELIEHVRERVVQFLDIRAPVSEAQYTAALPEDQRPPLPDDLVQAVRSADLLLFDLFGDAGMLLPPQHYAATLAATLAETLAAVRPLSPVDPLAAEACGILERLAAFVHPYDASAEAISLTPWASGATEAKAKWLDLLEKLSHTASAWAAAPHFAGESAADWAALSRTLAERHNFLRLQLAMVVAVERADPTCRYLVSSKNALAQIDGERLGLSRRRRLHEHSEAKIMGEKLKGRIEAVAAAAPDDALSPAGLIAHCRRLLALHMARRQDPNVRELAIACGDNIAWWLGALLESAEANPDAQWSLDEPPLVTAARAAAATARDLVDGYYLPKQHKGLRTLIPLRWGDALDDTLSRV